ncbi:hypothetical protein DSO57_1017350 [Entomophthora muscae]|uniref:Uncharacterized protein n=1 Tax=Entomophthora muscae TaxID=34485 RepID=A0ACC2SHH6_9FUNG|nr:hypothetical protein DSO57_1017350 [Entomophthora muscae]
MFDTLQVMMTILTIPPPPGVRIPRWPGAMELIPMILDPEKHGSRASFLRSPDATHIQFKNQSLDAIQKEAVRHALSSQHIALISGPPGTGKTTVLVEIIQQLASQDQRVLVCGNSTATVDNIFTMLVANKVRCLRLGNLKHSQHPCINECTMDYQLINGPTGPNIIHLKSSLREPLNGRPRQHSSEKIREMRQELSRLELIGFKDIVSGARIVLSTLTDASREGLRNHCFDVAIIDEASAALDPECWLAISHANRIVMSGDNHQLSPTVISHSSYLEKTLFKRMMDFCPYLLVSLTQQYRMNSTIMQFPFRYLYRQAITTPLTVKHRLLSHLPHVEENDFTSRSLLFINTSNCNISENPDSGSKWNPGESSLVVGHVAKLIAAGVEADMIGVISLYSAQTEVLRAMIQPRFPKVEVGSVDAFQGREKEAIIVSLVRSNPLKRVGLLRDYRRLNVAMTRARRHLCIAGDGENLLDHNQVPNNDSQFDASFLPAFGNHLGRFADTWLPEMYL